MPFPNRLRHLFGSRRRKLWAWAAVSTFIHASTLLTYNIYSDVTSNSDYKKQYATNYTSILLIASIFERMAYFGMYLVSIFLTFVGFRKRIRLKSSALPIYIIFFLNECVTMIFQGIMGYFPALNMGFGFGLMVTSAMVLYAYRLLHIDIFTGKMPCPCCGIDIWID
ncbi:unnamed protein product, partial [Mesorhabditis spiculigera]